MWDFLNCLKLIGSMNYIDQKFISKYGLVNDPKRMSTYSELVDTITTLEYPAHNYLNYIWDHVSYMRTYDADAYVYYWAISIEDNDLVKSIVTRRHIDPAEVRLTQDMYISITLAHPNLELNYIDYESDTPSLEIASAYGNDELVLWFLQNTKLRIILVMLYH